MSNTFEYVQVHRAFCIFLCLVKHKFSRKYVNVFLTKLFLTVRCMQNNFINI